MSRPAPGEALGGEDLPAAAGDGAPVLPPAPVLAIRQDWGDLVVGAALLALAGWFFVEAGRIEDYSGGAIGAADFPQGLAVLLAIGLGVMMAGSLRRLASGSPNPAVIAVRRYGHVLAGMALLIAFPVLMDAFGYYAAMGVWLPAFLVLAGIRDPLQVAAYDGGFLLFTYVVFQKVLGTPLPPWPY